MLDKATGYLTEAELSDFKKVIEEKIEQAKHQFNFYQEQVFDFTDMMEDEQSEWGDESLIQKDISLLAELAQQQIKRIEKLEAAKRRVRRGTFGICELTGELMDKKRLLADPGMTNSLEEESLFSDQIFEDIRIDFTVGQKSDSFSDFEFEEAAQEDYISLDEIADEYGFDEEYDI